MKIQITDQKILPRVSRGVDFGKERKIIAIHGTRQLVWTPGHTAWFDRITGSSYTRGTMDVLDIEKSYPASHTEITQGDYAKEGEPYNLSKETLEYFAEKISKMMQVPIELVPQLYKRGKTVVIE